jgi:hypothetical protein
VTESDGQVSWYPSRDIAPLSFDEAAPRGEQATP